MRELIKPKTINFEKETFSDTSGKFIIEPLESGYGITLGNALRRVLLSSIPGVAITSVKIDGVMHEFSTIPGVKESVLEIIQNLKHVRGRLFVKGEKKIALDLKGPVEIKASHFQTDNEVQITNPELHIATVSDEKTHLSMEVTLAEGRGYVEAAENKNLNQPLGTIPIDSIFTPIRKVKYEVRPARIGRKTSYDCLVLEVFTDRTIKPDEAVREAVKILYKYFEFLTREELEEKREEEALSRKEFLDQEIEKIGLSGSPLIALKNSGIHKIKDLMGKNENELLRIENFGEKSLEKVKQKLADYDLNLGKGGENETQEKKEKIGAK